MLDRRNKHHKIFLIRQPWVDWTYTQQGIMQTPCCLYIHYVEPHTRALGSVLLTFIFWCPLIWIISLSLSLSHKDHGLITCKLQEPYIHSNSQILSISYRCSALLLRDVKGPCDLLIQFCQVLWMQTNHTCNWQTKLWIGVRKWINGCCSDL